MFDHRRVHTLYLGPIHKNWILYGTVTFQAFKLAAYWWVYTTFIGSQINGFCLDSCRIPIFVGGLSPFWLVESHPILVLHHVKAMARSRWWPTPWTKVPSRFQVCMCIYTHIYIYTHMSLHTLPTKLTGAPIHPLMTLESPKLQAMSGQVGSQRWFNDFWINENVGLPPASIHLPRRSNARVLKCSCSGPLWLGSNICASQHQQFIPFFLSELLIFMTIETPMV